MRELVLEFQHRSGMADINKLIAIIEIVFGMLVKECNMTIDDEFLNKYRRGIINLLMMTLHNSIVTKQHFVWDQTVIFIK